MVGFHRQKQNCMKLDANAYVRNIIQVGLISEMEKPQMNLR